MDDYNSFTAGDTLSSEDRTIAALFNSENEAEQARDALEAAGFTSASISRKSSDATSADDDDKGLWQSIKDFFSGDNDADVYGEGVRRGKFLVTVHASDARADDAIDILDRFDPIDLDTHEQDWRSEGWSGESVTAVGDTSEGHNRDAFDSEPGAIPGRRDRDRGNVRVRSYLRDLT